VKSHDIIVTVTQLNRLFASINPASPMSLIRDLCLDLKLDVDSPIFRTSIPLGGLLIAILSHRASNTQSVDNLVSRLEDVLEYLA